MLLLSKKNHMGTRGVWAPAWGLGTPPMHTWRLGLPQGWAHPNAHVAFGLLPQLWAHPAHIWCCAITSVLGTLPAHTWHLGSCLSTRDTHAHTWSLGCLPKGWTHPSTHVALGHAKTQLSLAPVCFRTQNSLELLAVQGPK